MRQTTACWEAEEWTAPYTGRRDPVFWLSAERLEAAARERPKITKGYNLKASYVIHTVGPVYSGIPQDEKKLRDCYINSLELAKSHNIHTIAFPAISTGVYGYPVNEAVPAAAAAVTRWLEENSGYDMEITFVCYSREMYEAYLKAVK